MFSDESIKKKLKGKKILFVDDDLITIISYKQILESYGAIVESVESLADALSYFPENSPSDACPFDLVFIDCNLGSDKAPKRLEKFLLGKGINKFNIGAVFGALLKEKFPTVKYAYLTVIPDAIKELVKSQPTATVIDKYNTAIKDFPAKAYSILTDADLCVS